MAAKKTSLKTANGTATPVTTVAGFALFRTKPRRKAAPVPSTDSATYLVTKAGVALKKPGVSKATVFRDAKSGVFMYSAYPKDPTKLVRESADGTKRVGRFVKGKFVVAKGV